ncbi:MAG: hypothetical protein A2Z27_01130 [candidate division Zixibacteria bacterium RBG_16_50_21]|nr:MAG: hypothetical protein A2Z27_01130 [candidate division Zixibacteria bacterium RBG_16_50_21]
MPLIKTRLFFFCALLVIALPLWCFSQPSDSVDLWLDYSCFASGQDSLTTLEIYYGFDRRELNVDQSDTSKQIDLNLEVRTSTDSLLDTLNWAVSYTPSPADSAAIGQFLSDLVSIWIKPGEYRLVLRCQDKATLRSGRTEVKVKVSEFSGDALGVSSLQLALQISESGQKNRFTKHSKLVVPNPTTVYGSLNPMLYFYCEVYNLAPAAVDSSYQIAYEVLDSSGALFKEYGRSLKTKPGNSAVIATGLNIASLPLGRYQLRISVTDPASGQSAQAKKTFFVYREEEIRASAQAVPEPANEDQAARIREIISYLTTPDQLKLYDGLTLEGKQNFLKDFWQKKDPDPLTAVNEYKQDVYRRFAFAIASFSTGRIKPNQGWKSDRGRVYIIYGPPDRIIPHAYATATKPWDKWEYYNVQGGVFFVFEDQNGYGDYVLVHSTAKGEKYDPKWNQFMEQDILAPIE